MVTFVMSDIEGSTRLLRHLGDEYSAVLWRHRDLMRQAWAHHDGQEVDCQGDGSLVAFAATEDALAACANAQARLAAEAWPHAASVRVRMGVHAGLAAPRGPGYVAMAVHQVARIAQVAHGGQVAVSEQAVQQVPPTAASRLAPLGRYRVRDFDQPVQIFQLLEPGPAVDFPALRAMPADRHNLGTPAGDLIGRDRDLEQLRTAIVRHRLVTVVGAAGVGKTRLVTELGMALAGQWAHGVWLVECGPLEDPAMLPAAVAAALGVAAVTGDDATAELVRHLSERRMLLLLDGCERHPDAVGDLVRTLRGECPLVQMVATSTEPLHIAGEALLRLEPLPTGSPGSAATRLFIDRAEELNPRFRLDDEGTRAVVDLCRRLDGLPLAVEIAAARTTVLHPVQILNGLHRGLGMLQMRDRARPSRQQTLGGLLDWSFKLLTEDESTAMRRLSLFASTFDQAAANALAGDGLSADDLPELVWSLVDKSLLVADPVAGGTRYRSLETVRAYARDRLEPAETAACAGRLMDYYLDLLGPERGTGRHWMHSMEAERDNLRAILRLTAGDRERAQRLACAIARHHDAVQSFHVGIVEVTSLADRLESPTPAYVGLLTALGDLHARVEDVGGAERRAVAARELRRQVGAPSWDEVGVERLFGDVALRRRQPNKAAALARHTLEGPLSPRGRARMYNLLGIALATAHREDDAAAAFRAELAAAREADDEVLLAHAHCNMAEILLRLNEIPAAAYHQRACLQSAIIDGQTGMIALALLGAGRVTAAGGDDGDWRLATRLTARSQAMLSEVRGRMYDTDTDELNAFSTDARRRLGEAQYLDEWQTGEGLAGHESLALAFGVLAAAGGWRRSAGSRSTSMEVTT
jgi:predicted ATPase/class 3 adenylate cyclase